MPSLLVLGIGNLLLSDEGVGIHTLHYLEAHHPELCKNARLLDGGTLSFTLAGAIESAQRLIVIDAARLEAEPGCVRCFQGEAMDRFVARGNLSVHEVGLADLMDIARLTGSLPSQRALLGIQPQSLGWGEVLSPAVAGALPGVAEWITRLISRWNGESGLGLDDSQPQQPLPAA